MTTRTHELQVIDRTPHEHIEILANGVVVTGEPTDSELATVFEKLADYGDAKVWGVGDLCLWFQQHKERRDQFEQFVSLTRYSMGGCLNARRLCDRFPGEKRIYKVAPDYYRRVITLDDTDAFDILATVMRSEGDDMREWVRSEVKRRKNQPDPRKHICTLAIAADGTAHLLEPPPEWVRGSHYEITLRERIAA